jgi:transglutaminase-like putative cysteine protease
VRIRLGYDIRFEIPAPVAMVALLQVHSSRKHDLLEPDKFSVESTILTGETTSLPLETYRDCFGNACTRFTAPVGTLRLYSASMIEDSGLPDPYEPTAKQAPVEELPTEVLQYLLASRYCEVDLLQNTASELFGHIDPGWARVEAVCTWVNSKVRFGYEFARPTKTALNVYTERAGVCRDFQHLAVTFCRCLNIPARYVSGYLPDIGVAPSGPMDFSAWFEAFLDGRWWTFDARHHQPRIGRVLMVTGRDAADTAITTSFGASLLTNFSVVAEQVAAKLVT